LSRVELSNDIFKVARDKTSGETAKKDNVTSLIKILWSMALKTTTKERERKGKKPTRNHYLLPGTFAEVVWTNYN
jgi:hypothetical protein